MQRVSHVKIGDKLQKDDFHDVQKSVDQLNAIKNAADYVLSTYSPPSEPWSFIKKISVAALVTVTTVATVKVGFWFYDQFQRLRTTRQVVQDCSVVSNAQGLTEENGQVEPNTLAIERVHVLETPVRVDELFNYRDESDGEEYAEYMPDEPLEIPEQPVFADVDPNEAQFLARDVEIDVINQEALMTSKTKAEQKFRWTPVITREYVIRMMRLNGTMDGVTGLEETLRKVAYDALRDTTVKPVNYISVIEDCMAMFTVISAKQLKTQYMLEIVNSPSLLMRLYSYLNGTATKSTIKRSIIG